MKINKLYISFGSSGKVNHVSFYRSTDKPSNEVYPITEASSKRIYQLLNSGRLTIDSIRGSSVSWMAEGRFSVIDNSRMVPTGQQLMMDSIGHYLDDEMDYIPTQGEVNEFLDKLRDSAVTNMFGAASYIMQEFDVSKKRADDYLIAWMNKTSPIE